MRICRDVFQEMATQNNTVSWNNDFNQALLFPNVASSSLVLFKACHDPLRYGQNGGLTDPFESQRYYPTVFQFNVPVETKIKRYLLKNGG